MNARRGEALEFTVTPTIENRPVVLETDRTSPRQHRRWIILGLVVVTAAAFDGWQKHEPMRQGYRVNDIRKDRAYEEVVRRKLELELQSLQAPAALENWALRHLDLAPVPAADFVVIERVLPSGSLPSSVLASR